MLWKAGTAAPAGSSRKAVPTLGVAKRCFVAAVILLLGCLDSGGDLERWPLTGFSSDKWKAAKPENRYVYFRDLDRQGLLIGATREEVSRLLGEPDFKEPEGRYVTYIVKYAGADEKTLNSVFILHIDFGSDGLVSEYRIRGD